MKHIFIYRDCSKTRDGYTVLPYRTLILLTSSFSLPFWTLLHISIMHACRCRRRV